MSEGVTVGSFGTRFEAELARAALSNAGIPSTLVVEDEPGSLPQVAYRDGTIRVEVLWEHEHFAARVLEVDRTQIPESSGAGLTRLILIAAIGLAAVMAVVAVGLLFG